VDTTKKEPSVMKSGKIVLALAVWLAAAGGSEAQASPVVFSATGINAAGILTTVTDFRNALGPLNPNVAGSLGSGRREINWDGVPNQFASPNAFPVDFFNINSPRGVVYSTPGDGFQVSGAAGVAPIEFDNLDPNNSAQFAPFSGQRLFTAVNSFITDVTFFVPGSNQFAAATNGFGVVFTDVDAANTTSLEFFDIAGASLGLFYVPNIAGNETFSFLGVLFNQGELISRVRITSGGPNDAVVMDDFIYGEPTPVPEPASIMLLGGGLAMVARRLRRSRGK